MTDKLKKQIIENYIEAYNNFDIEKMLTDLHEDIVFENFSGVDLTLYTKGISEFKIQANKAKDFFNQRTQKINEMSFNDDSVEVKIDYCCVLAADLENGLKAGDKIELKGKSIFRFADGKIIEITDIS